MTLPQRPPAILSRPFLAVTGSALLVFIGFGATIALLPQYVKEDLGRGDTAVGVVFGSISVAAVAVRAVAGGWGDRYGRRVLMVAGAAVTGAAIALHGLADDLPTLIGLRLLTGAGEGVFFVGAATLISDLAPADRRGEAISYFSVATYAGLGIGPTLGEAVLDGAGFTPAWAVAGGLCLVGAALATVVPARVRRSGSDPAAVAAPVTGARRFFHPAAIGPGSVLALGLIGYASFSAYVPLHVDSVGLDDSRYVFLFYSALVVAVRLFGARLPDVLGPRVSGTSALVVLSAGLLVLFSWRSGPGVFAATVGVAGGMSLLYPALFTAAVNRAPDEERASVVASFTMFFDVSVGVGGLVLGIVAGLSSPQGAFLAGAVIAASGILLLLGVVAPSRRVTTDRSPPARPGPPPTPPPRRAPAAER